MRLFAALSMFLLAGCGIAVSDKPMLTAADTAGAPQFADGVWLMPEFDEEVDCAVDVTKPVSAWPDCATWALHKDGQWFARQGNSGIATKAVPRDAVVVSNGDIAIVQLESEPGEDGTVDPTPFTFIAFDNKPAATAPLRTLGFWMVMCGKYEPVEGAAEDEADKLVRFPGFDEKCRPESVQVLRDAAAASRPAADHAMPTFGWARTALD
ncbi:MULTISPECIES: hypothetical protein [unclassified Sphingopyxis]|uniref:hypothetical protein n=1 Tax=unclassified Sphingopyxis TaxID=2614943 RepID=UPI0007363767|nr:MULTISPECIES: hypothetical protein [unclassified Sphingopyxis]KTE32591.1 hypothetical protein ATE62_17895 [Sphingopyxis sp. HIX]KTE83365.1 hypothetical protein ATE72_14385 [Sphingopyxis sp. HXXIV]